MTKEKRSRNNLLSEMERLRSRLEETEAALREARQGMTDATDFGKREEESRESLGKPEARYRVVAENSRDMVSWLGPAMDYLFISPSCKRITGHNPEEFEADPDLLFKIMHPDDRSLYREHLARMRQEMEPGELEYRILHEDGTWRWLSHLCRPVFDGTDRFLGTLCSDRDVTEHRKVEAELRESRERLKNVLEGITDGYISMDRRWRFVEVNPVAERIVFRRPAGELLGKVQWKEYPHAVGKEFYRQYHRAVEEGRPVHFEAPSMIGEGRWFEVHAYPRGDLLEVYMRDITERKAMEEELRRSRDRMERRVEERTKALLRANKLLEDIFSSTHILIAYLDRDFRCIRANARFAEATGNTPDFVVGKRFTQLFPIRDAETVLHRAVETGKAYRSHEAPFMDPERPDGPVTYWDWSLNPIEDADGRVDGLIFTAVDKTGHVQAEEQIRKASHIIENAGFGIAIVDPGSNTYEYVNPAYAAQHGYEAFEMKGMGVKDAYLEDLRSRSGAAARELGAGGHAIFESIHVRKDGSTFPVLINAVEMKDAGGKALYTAVFTEDISQLKRAMEALQENQKRLATVLETLPVGVWIMDGRGLVVHANVAAQEIWGREQPMREDRVGEYKAWWPGGKGRLRPDEWAGVKAVSRGETTLNVEMEIEAFDGIRKIVLVSAGPIRSGRDEIFGSVTVFQDITGMRQSEKTFRRLAAAIEQAHENVIIADKNGVVEYVNPRFEEHTGYGSSEIVGRKLSVLKDGTYNERHFPNLWQTVTGGNTWTGRAARRKKDGTSYEAESTISPVRDGSGSVIGAVVVERDVTEQARLERQIRQAQKMEAIGTLAGGIAHDFNNVIAGIIGFTEMAIEETEPGTALNRRLSLVLKGAHRGRDLIKQILAFSRATEQEKKPLKISYVVEEALKFLRASIPVTIEIRKNILTQSDIILADRTEIHQVLLNLCTNAAYAMREKGGILEVILSGAPAAAEEHGRLYGEGVPGAYAKLTVRDSGPGMEPEVMERIFDPFFTTKRPGEGTGLGLSVVHGIVKRHQGLIAVESVPGKGSSFHLFFPVLSMDQIPPDTEKESLVTGRGRILFVDDEELLVEMNRGRLEGLGYEVVGETDPLRALGLFRDDPDRFDLVITDYTMPQMTGIDLSRKIVALKPGVPVVLCSGLDELVSRELVEEAGIREFLPKAVGKRELVRVVQSLIGKKE